MINSVKRVYVFVYESGYEPVICVPVVRGGGKDLTEMAFIAGNVELLTASS